MRKELLFRKDDSIRRRIRNYVFELLNSNEDEYAKEISKSAVKVYDFRSTLVHGGGIDESDLSENLTKAKEIVEKVLIYRFEDEVGIK